MAAILAVCVAVGVHFGWSGNDEMPAIIIAAAGVGWDFGDTD